MSADKAHQLAISRIHGWFVYVISESGNAFTKIGTACTPEYRLNGLQNGNPRKLTIVSVWHFASREDALRIEQAALAMFEVERLSRRDWVAAPYEAVISEVRHCISRMKIMASEISQ